MLKSITCNYILECLRATPLVGDNVDKLRDLNGLAVFGDVVNLPNLGKSPERHICNHSAVVEYISNNDLKLTYAEITQRSLYGVYHTYMLRFGDKVWVSRDQSGLVVCYIFSEAF